MFRSRIEPAFGAMLLRSVNAADVVAWRNALIADGRSETYMRTLRNQLAALFNHACKIYGLRENPVAKAGPFGSKEAAPRKLALRGFWWVARARTERKRGRRTTGLPA